MSKTKLAMKFIPAPVGHSTEEFYGVKRAQEIKDKRERTYQERGIDRGTMRGAKWMRRGDERRPVKLMDISKYEAEGWVIPIKKPRTVVGEAISRGQIQAWKRRRADKKGLQAFSEKISKARLATEAKKHS